MFAYLRSEQRGTDFACVNKGLFWCELFSTVDKLDQISYLGDTAVGLCGQIEEVFILFSIVAQTNVSGKSALLELRLVTCDICICSEVFYSQCTVIHIKAISEDNDYLNSIS